jgi:hypothetical protein
MIDTVIQYIYIVVALASCIWIYRDSSELMKGLTVQERKSASMLAVTNPILWAIGCWVLWPLIPLWYLSVRKTYRRLKEEKSQADPAAAATKPT